MCRLASKAVLYKTLKDWLLLCVSGKKGSELGDYDPLTQADSDESEEDDLVLNYPRNGHTGRPERLNEARDNEEEDDEDDEWTERISGKSRRDRGELKNGQFRNHRDSGREKNGEERGPAGTSEGLGVHSAEGEKKRMRTKNLVRSAFFLVPLVCAAVIVLLCVFLVPCQKGELQEKLQWEKALGDKVGKEPFTHNLNTGTTNSYLLFIQIRLK